MSREQAMRDRKREAFEAALSKGNVIVQLDSTAVGVMIPSHLRAQPTTVLEYGHNLPVPIPELTADDFRLRALLSFDRVQHFTIVPWDAVFAIVATDGLTSLWLGSAPKAWLDQVGRAPAPKRSRSLLTVIKGGKA